jgi:hypothetical protein
VKGENCVLLPHLTVHSPQMTETEFEIFVPEQIGVSNRLVLEMEADGKMTVGYVPVTLLG